MGEPSGLRSVPALEATVRVGRIRLLWSTASMAELAEVLARPKIRRRVPALHAEAFIHALMTAGEQVVVRSHVSVCRDPKDDFLLALAKDGWDDVLITGDDDLLALGRYGTTRILGPAAFLAELP